VRRRARGASSGQRRGAAHHNSIALSVGYACALYYVDGAPRTARGLVAQGGARAGAGRRAGRRRSWRTAPSSSSAPTAPRCDEACAAASPLPENPLPGTPIPRYPVARSPVISASADNPPSLSGVKQCEAQARVRGRCGSLCEPLKHVNAARTARNPCRPPRSTVREVRVMRPAREVR
jgi:hypothetical protein